MMSKETKLLELQKSFEDGKIKEDDLNEEQKKRLIELYNEQIEALHRDAERYKSIFQEFKEKIINIRKKI